ncbi:hypothetical protein CRENBAI_014428 [Crenichthys baileyi]|uniref:Uncharacterized protein n=1 Tax=Crenichthys baileyi TaxID=28760 RepID=A0AAV9R5Q8_9TELE
MRSAGKYCVFLLLLKSVLSDSGTSNQVVLLDTTTVLGELDWKTFPVNGTSPSSPWRRLESANLLKDWRRSAHPCGSFLLPPPLPSPLRVGATLRLLATPLISHSHFSLFLVLFRRSPLTSLLHILFLSMRGSRTHCLHFLSVPGPVLEESEDKPPSHPVTAREWFGDGLPPLLVPVPGELEDKLPPLPILVCEGCEDALPPSAEPQWLHCRSLWLCCRSPGLRHGSPRPRRGFQRFLHRSPGVRRFLHRSPGSQRFLSCSLLSSTVVSSLLSSTVVPGLTGSTAGFIMADIIIGCSEGPLHIWVDLLASFFVGASGSAAGLQTACAFIAGPSRLCLGLRRRPPELCVYMGRPPDRSLELCVCTGLPSGCPPELWISPGRPSGRPPELCFGFVSGPVPGTFLFLFCFLRVS